MHRENLFLFLFVYNHQSYQMRIQPSWPHLNYLLKVLSPNPITLGVQDSTRALYGNTIQFIVSSFIKWMTQLFHIVPSCQGNTTTFVSVFQPFNMREIILGYKKGLTLFLVSQWRCVWETNYIKICMWSHPFSTSKCKIQRHKCKGAKLSCNNFP